MKVFLAVVLFLFLVSSVSAQQVYRCEVDEQTVFSDQPCEEDAEQIDIKPIYQPDQAATAAVRGVEFRRRTCQARTTGTAEAIVELVNTTGEVKSGELRIQFINNGQIIDVHSTRFSLGSWESDTISRLGPPRVSVDRCEYSIRVEQS